MRMVWLTSCTVHLQWRQDHSTDTEGSVQSEVGHPPADVTVTLVFGTEKAARRSNPGQAVPVIQSVLADCIQQPRLQDPSGHLAFAFMLARLPCQQTHYFT